MVLYCTDNKTDRANGSVDDILCDLPSACQFFQRSAWIVFSSDLQGGHDMDRHVHDTPLAENMPATLALQTIWYSNFRRSTSHLIASYDRCLQRFPAHLQQLTIESIGQNAHQMAVRRIMPTVRKSEPKRLGSRCPRSRLFRPGRRNRKAARSSRLFSGNLPSIIMLAQRMDQQTLGMIALSTANSWPVQ